MAGKITALKIQKNNKERVNVFIDEVYTLAVTVMVAATLKKGQYLSDTDIEQLKNEDERHKAYQRALHFLSFRARSRAEMERYLQDKGYSPEIVTEIIERLQRERYLDDKAFAEMWLENRERFRPRSQRALRYELRQKGIDEAVIDAVLVDVDEDELAWAAVEPKLNGWKNLPEEDLKKKLMGFLGRRGFNYEIARSVFEQAWQILHSSE
jgi:regulatory protein